MTNANSFWKRLLVLAGAVVLTLGRLWHTASSLILPQHEAQKTASSVAGNNSEKALSTTNKRGQHHRSSGLYPCEPAQTDKASLTHDGLDRLVLLTYTVSSTTLGYGDLPKGSSAKMLLIQGSCDDSSDGGGGDDSSDGGGGDDSGGDSSDDSDSSDYDDSGDTSDDA